MNESYNFVLQEDKYDCGIACLITIFLQFGIKISRERILELINIDDGVSAYDLIRVSKVIGVAAKGVKATINDLNDKSYPVIAHTIKNKSYFHYIVILRNNKKSKKLIVMDPTIGICEKSYEEFENETTGIFILFSSDILKRDRDKRFKKVIIDLLKNNKSIILLIIGLSLLFIIISILSNYYFSNLTKFLDNGLTNLIRISFIYLLVYLFKNVVGFIKDKLVIFLNIKIDKKMIKKVFNHIIFLPYKYFYKKTTGELSTIINDIENFRIITEKFLIMCIIDILVILSLLIYLVSFSYVYCIIYIIFIAVLIFISYKYQNIFNSRYLKLKSDKIIFNSKIFNFFTSFNTIKSLHVEDKICKRVGSTYKKVSDSTNDYYKISNNYKYVLNNIIDIFYILIMLFSSYLVVKERISIYDMILFSSLFYFGVSYIANICDVVIYFTIYQSSINKILDILDIEKEEFKETKLSRIKSIDFIDVTYVINNKSVLDKVNLKINRGSHLFITGKSGIGKSTLIKLLLKYDKLTGGKILIDGIDIKYLPLEYIRNSITYVSQNEMLYNDSIINNMKLITSDKKKINKAFKTCLINEILEKKKIDEDYFIEENCNNFSGGERKKMIIARALLKIKDILIFDESFNEIDVKEEKIILNNIFKYYPSLTVILISHRKNNVCMFNKVFELREVYERNK